MSVKDEDILKPLDATASTGLLSIDERILDAFLRYGSSIELQEIADRLGPRRKTLRGKKKQWGL